MTKHFSWQSVSETAKSDAWAALNIVSLYPTPELRRIMKKRQSLLDAVSEQILMATTRSYTPTKSKWITEADGNVRRVQVPIQLKKWWTQIPNGKLHLCVFVKGKPLELEPGKTAIEIEGIAELIPTLKLVHQSIELGDFDDLF
ncbi:MAG: DUF6641 family protein [Paracoccaceae bacterium]